MNYEDVIEAALKQGDSFEQIAAAFSEALNKREKDDRRIRDRQDLCQECADTMRYAVNDDVYLLGHIANAAILWVADMEANWDADRLRNFGDAVAEYAEEMHTEWVNLDMKMNSTKAQKSSSDNKREEEERTKRAAPAGNPHVTTIEVDPAEIAASIKEKYPNLYAWLNGLNLM